MVLLNKELNRNTGIFMYYFSEKRMHIKASRPYDELGDTTYTAPLPTVQP
jgi:hypothetical protein